MLNAILNATSDAASTGSNNRRITGLSVARVWNPVSDVEDMEARPGFEPGWRFCSRRRRKNRNHEIRRNSQRTQELLLTWLLRGTWKTTRFLVANGTEMGQLITASPAHVFWSRR